MSKIGKQPIKIPDGVTVEINGRKVIVKGPKGSLALDVRSELEVKKSGDQIEVIRKKQNRLSHCLHGLSRTLISNMVKGVTELFTKTLELQGVGYRAFLEGEDLKITVGFSHPVMVKKVAGINFEVEGSNIIKISGADKQLVGQIAAQIRAIKPPEPYKGKGIRYQNEVVKLKAGKAAKVGAAVG